MQGTVKYSKEYIMPDGLKVWLGHEMEYNMETQDPPFEQCALVVHNFASGIKPQSHTNGSIMDMALNRTDKLYEIQVDKEAAIGLTTESILSCTDLTVLEQTYKWLVKGKPELERAYQLRHDQLTDWDYLKGTT